MKLTPRALQVDCVDPSLHIPPATAHHTPHPPWHAQVVPSNAVEAAGPSSWSSPAVAARRSSVGKLQWRERRQTARHLQHLSSCRISINTLVTASKASCKGRRTSQGGLPACHGTNRGLEPRAASACVQIQSVRQQSVSRSVQSLPGASPRKALASLGWQPESARKRPAVAEKGQGWLAPARNGTHRQANAEALALSQARQLCLQHDP